MSASVVTAALAAGEEPSPLVPPLGELIVGIVAFTLLYLFLRAKVFPIFERVYAERAKAIEGGMERAHKAEEEAEALLVQYRSQLASAREEAAEIRAKAQSDRQAIVAEARTEAEQEAQRVTEQANARIEADVSRVRSQLSREVGAMATTLAEKIVGDELDGTRVTSTVDRFIADLERGDGGPVPAGTDGGRTR
jgi:F-type H+-transporting ATPase subunit b